MNADTLRRAAVSMRDHATAARLGRWDVTAFPLADWLEDVAADLDADLWPDGHDVPRNAVAVARAYLGEEVPR